jgi:hypothetical protein
MATETMLASDSPISAAMRASVPRSLWIRMVMRQSKRRFSRGPDQVDPAVRFLLVQALGGFAFLGMHDQGLVRLEIAGQAVARDRHAAGRQLRRRPSLR